MIRVVVDQMLVLLMQRVGVGVTPKKNFQCIMNPVHNFTYLIFWEGWALLPDPPFRP